MQAALRARWRPRGREACLLVRHKRDGDGGNHLDIVGCQALEQRLQGGVGGGSAALSRFRTRRDVSRATLARPKSRPRCEPRHKHSPLQPCSGRGPYGRLGAKGGNQEAEASSPVDMYCGSRATLSVLHTRVPAARRPHLHALLADCAHKAVHHASVRHRLAVVGVQVLGPRPPGHLQPPSHHVKRVGQRLQRGRRRRRRARDILSGA